MDMQTNVCIAIGRYVEENGSFEKFGINDHIDPDRIIWLYRFIRFLKIRLIGRIIMSGVLVSVCIVEMSQLFRRIILDGGLPGHMWLLFGTFLTVSFSLSFVKRTLLLRVYWLIYDATSNGIRTLRICEGLDRHRRAVWLTRLANVVRKVQEGKS